MFKQEGSPVFWATFFVEILHHWISLYLSIELTNDPSWLHECRQEELFVSGSVAIRKLPDAR